MLRCLYIQFIWLHPAPFRWRFGDDMLDDFDRARLRDKPRYFADAAVSLARQWILRPEFRQMEESAAGAPMFHVMETYKPRPAALLDGALLTMLLFLTAVFLIGKGGGVARPFFIGAHFSRPGILPIERNSVAAGNLDSTVEVGADPIDPWLELARPYFDAMPALRTLDSDHNLTLSPAEIAKAPAALRKLDTNHDGKLTAEECRLRGAMSSHPALAALDEDRDGEISAREIDHAATSLKTLDRNHDGYLTPDELLPPRGD